MIKCEVKVSGTVKTVPIIRQDKNGTSYAQFTIVVVFSGVDGTVVNQDVNVYTEPTADIMSLASGVRVGFKGELTFRKRGENLYFNLSHSTLETPTTTDSITGQASFQGRIGTDVVQKEDKHHKPFIIFRGYSTEKVNETFESTWLQFIGFGMNPEPWMQKKAPCDVAGAIEISCYKSKISLSCRMSSIKEKALQAQPE